jgi:PiT family inorganic phosphate transporter
MLFEFLGAYLAGGEVTATIRKGIIDPELLADDPQLLVYGMMSALFAAGTWLMIASVRGWPVSTTHSIVGAIVGFAAVGISADAVSWGQVGAIAASWVMSPLLAGSISFGLFMSVKALILDTDDPFARAKRFIPFYMWIVGFMIAMVTLLKGLKHLGFSIDFGLGSRFPTPCPWRPWSVWWSRSAARSCCAASRGPQRGQPLCQRGARVRRADGVHRLLHGLRPRLQ